MLTSVANSSLLSSMLATVTSPWLTKGKSKGLVEIRSRSVKHKDPFSILCMTLGIFPNATN
jgi:hypothetical protein